MFFYCQVPRALLSYHILLLFNTMPHCHTVMACPLKNVVYSRMGQQKSNGHIPLVFFSKFCVFFVLL